MKKILSIIAVLCLILGSATVFAEERGYINANASTEKEILPDVVDISISVVTYDTKSMQTATKNNKDLSDKLYSTLKSMINPANGDYVKTSDYRAQPLYTYTNNKRNFDKYEVSNKVLVHTKSINNVGSMIDKAIELGATNIDNLKFSVSSYDNICDEMLIKSAQKTKLRAENFAKATGTVITGVKLIDGSCSSANNSGRVMYTMNAKSAMMDSASATPIETGVVKIYANVNASYFVK